MMDKATLSYAVVTKRTFVDQDPWHSTMHFGDDYGACLNYYVEQVSFESKRASLIKGMATTISLEDIGMGQGTLHSLTIQNNK